MNDIVESLKRQFDLDVVEERECCRICVPRPEGVTFEIVIPHHIHEWFVTAKETKTNEKLWEDWMDYYRVNDETKEDLQLEMKHDIENFISCLLASKVRIVESKTLFRTVRRIEWKTNTDANWERISMYLKNK